MSVKSLLICHVREAAHDGQDVLTLPASHAFTAAGATVALQTTGAEKRIGFLQFLTRLATGDQVASAILRLRAAAAWSGPAGTLTAKTLDHWTLGLATPVETAAALSSAEALLGDWTADASYDFDVTAPVAAALAHASYARGKPITIALESTDATARAFHAFDGDRSRVAELHVKFTPATDTDEEPPELQTIKGLWSLLESSRDFAAAVPESNRIKFIGTNRDPLKQEVATADLPEVRIAPDIGGGMEAIISTSSAQTTFALSIQVATGDQRVDADGEGLHWLKWLIFRALADWPAVLMSLTWRGIPFVKNVKIAAVQDGTTDADLKRGIKGWTSVWSVRVDAYFQTAALRA